LELAALFELNIPDMATNKKPKKKKPQAKVVSLKPENLIVKRGRSMPIFECRVHEGWSDMGKTEVTVARRMPNGHLVVGFYMVDLWCLGLKDTFYKADMTMLEYEEMVEITSQEIPLEVVEPALAFNIIYAGIEYAEDLGFEPHKDFKHTQYLLPEPDDFEYIEVETGKNGRPFFTPGPYDKVTAIMQKLEKKLGKGNFEFMLEDDGDMFDTPYQPDHKLRGEVIRKYLPNDKVENKLNSLSEEEKTNFLYQTVIVTLAIEMAEGSLETLLEDYDDDFFDDLVDYYMDEMDGMRETDGLPPVEYTEKLEEAVEGFVNLIMARVMRYKSLDFMFDSKYKPLPDDLTQEEIDTLSPEELTAYLDDTFNTLTSEEKNFYNVRALTMLEVGEKYGVEDQIVIDDASKKTIMDNVWEKVKAQDENGFFDENNEEVMHRFRESVTQVIDTFNEPE
jgi:hypothetical protein